MENLNAINYLFIESAHHCQKDGCEKPGVLIDSISGCRFCIDHAPRLWVENAVRNEKRINYESAVTPSACVSW